MALLQLLPGCAFVADEPGSHTLIPLGADSVKQTGLLPILMCTYLTSIEEKKKERRLRHENMHDQDFAAENNSI